MQKLSICFIFATMLLSGCGGSATLFVHNDSEDMIRFEVDGKKRKSVMPRGGHTKQFIPFGEHRITVYRNKSVIFDEVKTFEPYADGPSWRHYILDPDADTSFDLHEVYYYENQETADSSESSRRLRSLPKKHWVDVPSGAFALEAMPVVFTSDETTTKRLAVLAD